MDSIRRRSEKMKEIVDVSTGEVALRRGEFILRALAIGSCIVVAAYDSGTKTAAMAHIMLPGSAPPDKGDDLKTRYTADAISEMLEQMRQLGSQKKDIKAALVGGGNVLKRKDDTICNENIKSTLQLLEDTDLAIIGNVLGGTHRRSASLDIEQGVIYYTEGGSSEIELWRAQG